MSYDDIMYTSMQTVIRIVMLTLNLSLLRGVHLVRCLPFFGLSASSPSTCPSISTCKSSVLWFGSDADLLVDLLGHHIGVVTRTACISSLLTHL